MGSFWHWLILLAIVAGLIVIVVLVTRRRAAAPEELRGIGGWLILPIIGFIGVIVLTLINLASALSEVEGLKAIFAGESEEARAIRLPVLLSLVFGLLVIASAATCLYKIFISGKNLRKFAVIHYVLLAMAGIVEFWGDHMIVAAIPGTPSDPHVARDAARGVFAALIWIPYFLVSKRVNNTFERPVLTEPVQRM